MAYGITFYRRIHWSRKIKVGTLTLAKFCSLSLDHFALWDQDPKRKIQHWVKVTWLLRTVTLRVIFITKAMFIFGSQTKSLSTCSRFIC